MQKKFSRLLLGTLATLAVLALTGCGDKEQQEINDYKIYKSKERVNEDCVDFFADRVEEYLDIKLGTFSGSRKNGVYLVCDGTYARELGYSTANMQENAFVISNRDNSIYIFAPNEEGLNRASSYFVRNYLDEQGKILLARDEKYIETGSPVQTEIYVGEIPIAEYDIAYSTKKLRPVCEELQYYIQQTSNDFVNIVSQKKADGPVISLMLDEELADGEGCLEIIDGQISIAAKDVETLYEEVYVFVNTYLGWMNAGEEDARCSSMSSVVRVPTEVSKKQAWMEEREATIVLWNTNYNRGMYLDPDTSLKSNLIDYSEEQLYEYVKMLKYCGFTGIQVTEMCSTWAGTGGYETAHEKIRTLADAAHSLDMNFTLWVWGAEFSGYGWVDNTVTYAPGESGYVKDNPKVVETFEKYYSIYAQLADCCDRVIAHYYDPGNLHDSEDIAYFAKMLKDKFQAVNPDIDFGVSCWVDVFDKRKFVSALGNDITLYECGHHDNENDYNSFRSLVNGLDCRIGTWAWNTCEMEIDQLAQMNFNMEIIRSVYQTARKYDTVAKSTYWSEMDSYHLVNVFSLYCAGQLLINPDMESQVLYHELSTAVVGPEYAEEFAEILSIIQDARSGYSWDTYFWSNENYILKSDAYPAEQILERCNTYIPVLQEMIDKGIESYTLPLPVSLQDLLRLMLPHLEQIRSFARFRIELAELEAAYESGMEPGVLNSPLKKERILRPM